MAGTGFPMKQKNKELECRIIQACDAFDSLISGMECKRICVQEAINQIKEMMAADLITKLLSACYHQ